jgi:prepilin-type processing-associated H-X9-DG protein
MDAFLSMAKAEEITEPEQMPLVYETRQLGRNASGYLTDVPSPGRHNSQSNYLFADFHVRSH